MSAFFINLQARRLALKARVVLVHRALRRVHFDLKLSVARSKLSATYLATQEDHYRQVRLGVRRVLKIVYTPTPTSAASLTWRPLWTRLAWRRRHRLARLLRRAARVAYCRCAMSQKSSHSSKPGRPKIRHLLFCPFDRFYLPGAPGFPMWSTLVYTHTRTLF